MQIMLYINLQLCTYQACSIISAAATCICTTYIHICTYLGTDTRYMYNVLAIIKGEVPGLSPPTRDMNHSRVRKI